VKKEEGPLKPKPLVSKLKEVFKGFETFKIKNRVKAINLQPLLITKKYTGAGGSNGSLVIEITSTQRSKTKKKTNPKDNRDIASTSLLGRPKKRGKATTEAAKKPKVDDNMDLVITILLKDT